MSLNRWSTLASFHRTIQNKYKETRQSPGQFDLIKIYDQIWLCCSWIRFVQNNSLRVERPRLLSPRNMPRNRNLDRMRNSWSSWKLNELWSYKIGRHVGDLVSMPVNWSHFVHTNNENGSIFNTNCRLDITWNWKIQSNLNTLWQQDSNVCCWHPVGHVSPVCCHAHCSCQLEYAGLDDSCYISVWDTLLMQPAQLQPSRQSRCCLA